VRRGHEAALARPRSASARARGSRGETGYGSGCSGRPPAHRAAVARRATPRRDAEAERRSLTEKAEIAEKHRAEVEQLISRATQVDAELAARNEELAETHRRLLRVEGELDTAGPMCATARSSWARHANRITDLESKVADLEDQALRAYRRIKDDEKTLDKAKRAVSVALTLLDERSTSSVPAPALARRRESDLAPMSATQAG